jgi:hypothetical protein
MFKRKIPVDQLPTSASKEEKDAWKKDQLRKREAYLKNYNYKHHIVAHHSSPDWPRKEVSKKAFRKHSKRARRFYAEANDGRR